MYLIYKRMENMQLETCNNCRWSRPATRGEIEGTIQLFEDIGKGQESVDVSGEDVAWMSSIIACMHRNQGRYNLRPGDSDCNVRIRSGFLGLENTMGFEEKAE
jgi:hypothetical protein